MNNEFVRVASTAPPLFLTIGIYLLCINLITFFVFGLDKYKSTKIGKRRISEKTLWILSLVGGSLGAFFAMNTFRHKTKKISFQLVQALIFLVQLSIIVVYFLYIS